ncbi:MAG: hypothetical protein H6609_20800 [Ignavibacteriales bacterium]|nr:hypothetical protein [Ignavibacteriales bacterium]
MSKEDFLKNNSSDMLIVIAPDLVQSFSVFSKFETDIIDYFKRRYIFYISHKLITEEISKINQHDKIQLIVQSHITKNKDIKTYDGYFDDIKEMKKKYVIFSLSPKNYPNISGTFYRVYKPEGSNYFDIELFIQSKTQKNFLLYTPNSKYNKLKLIQDKREWSTLLKRNPGKNNYFPILITDLKNDIVCDLVDTSDKFPLLNFKISSNLFNRNSLKIKIGKNNNVIVIDNLPKINPKTTITIRDSGNGIGYSNSGDIKKFNSGTELLARYSGGQCKVIIISDLLGDGGEGYVYNLKNDEKNVVKIYKKEHCENIYKKLTLMIKNPIKNFSISYPTALVFQAGKPVGFLMRKVRGRKLEDIIHYTELKEKYNKWTRKELVWIASNYIKLLDEIHSDNILLGDINPANILIDENKKTIAIIDLDSSQVGEYTCGVGIDDYLHPDIIIARKKNNNLLLRSMKHELFAVNLFIFFILMGGFHPYDHKGFDPGNGKHKNELKFFPYPIDSQGDSSKVPPGSRLKLWNILSKDMKLSFYDIFHEHKFKTLKELSEMLDNYSKYLDQTPIHHQIFF